MTWAKDSVRALHAALLRCTERVDERRSANLHGQRRGAHQTVRAWTVGNLYDSSSPIVAGCVTVAGQTLTARVTTLDRSTAQLLDATLERLVHGAVLTFEHLPFELVHQDDWAPGPVPARTAYHDLARPVSPSVEISLKFLSPTNFRRESGRLQRPDPDQCLRSYAVRWNEFAPSHLQVDVELLQAFARDHITIVREVLTRGEAKLGNFEEPGYTGEVTWEVDPRDREGACWVDLLTRYAEFCGTGAKTALGMGQTRRLR